MRQSTVAAALLTTTLFAAGARAQDDGLVGAQLVSVKAVEQPDTAPKPELPEALQRWKALLEHVPGFPTDKTLFEFQTSQLVRGAPGAKLSTGEALPLQLHAEVVATKRPDGKLDVTVELTRPGRPPKKPEEREKVLTHSVTAKDGETYVVRLQDAFRKGEHLLLLITPTTKVEAD